jgi:hypothetical protein
MVRLLKISVLLSLIIIMGGCKKHDEYFKTYSRPAWGVASPETLPYSFTAIVSIPENIDTYSSDEDIVAAFIGDECHGIGNLVTSENGTKKVYYITVRGSDTESRQIVFRYYNSKLSYMYEAKTTVPFEIEGVWGSYDTPFMLDLQIMN